VHLLVIVTLKRYYGDGSDFSSISSKNHLFLLEGSVCHFVDGGLILFLISSFFTNKLFSILLQLSQLLPKLHTLYVAVFTVISL